MAPTAAWPTDAYVKRTKDFFFNGEPILVYHPEAGVTDGDSIVHFRRSDVLVAGETWEPRAIRSSTSRTAAACRA